MVQDAATAKQPQLTAASHQPLMPRGSGGVDVAMPHAYAGGRGSAAHAGVLLPPAGIACILLHACLNLLT